MTTKSKLEWTPLAFDGAAKQVLEAKAKYEANVEKMKPLKEENVRLAAIMVSHLQPDYKAAGLIKPDHEMLLSNKFGQWAFASSPKAEKKASKAVSPADIKAFLASRK